MTENTWFKATEQPSERPLESWKEIATYLKRDVRTVRRWEKSEGLPVRRHMHESRSSVYAYPSELAAWQATRQPGTLREEETAAPRWRSLTALAAVLLLTLISVGSGPLPTRASAADGPELVARRILDRAPYGSVSADGRFVTDVDWSTGDLAVVDLATLKSRRLTNKGTWTASREYAELSVVSSDSKQIAYAWFNGRNYDLRVIGADGSGLRVLHAHPDVRYVFPGQWSPDGKYVTATLAKTDNTTQIVLVSVADGSNRVLRTLDWRAAFHVFFAPDGRHVVYNFPPLEDSPQRDVFMLATDGSAEVQLITHPANDVAFGWTRDGQELLFFSDRTGVRSVWAIRVHGGRPEGAPRLVRANVGEIIAQGITQQGSLYYSVSTRMRDGYVAPLDLVTGMGLGTPKPVEERMVGTTLWPRWSPDGKSLLYLQSTTLARGRLTIVIRSLETGEERTLRTELSIDHQFNTRPSLSPDGRSIFLAASDSKGRQGIYQVDARTAAATPVIRAEPSGVVRLPALSPDGKTLFYQQRGQGRTALVARELETGREKKIFEPDEQDGTLPYFSPSRDGRQLAFVQVERTMPARSALFVIPAVGGAPRELFRVEDPVSLLGPSTPGWTPDGRYIIVRTYREAKPEPERILWAIPAAGGAPKKLGLAPAGHMLGLDVHPDGQRIAFTAGESKQEFWVLQNFLPQTRAAK